MLSTAAFALLLYFVISSYPVTQAADPPSVVFETDDRPRPDRGTDASADPIVQPLPTVSRDDVDAGRKRAVPERRMRPFVRVGTPSERVDRDAATSNQKETHHRRAQTDTVTRCNLTNIILGFNYTDVLAETNVSWTPGSPYGAVGVSRLVAVGNSVMEIRQKDGTLLFRDGLQSFFSSFPEALETNRFNNPRVIYDQHQSRFVISVQQLSFSPQISRVWLAVSTDGTPSTGSNWHQTYIDSALSIGGANTFADSPLLAVDVEAVYVSATMYRFSDDVISGGRIWLFSKGVVGGFYAGQRFNTTTLNPFESRGLPRPMCPAKIPGSSGVDGSVGNFFVSAVGYFSGLIELQVYSISNPLSATPTARLEIFNLGFIQQPAGIVPQAPQLGTTETIDLADVRVQDAVWRNNTLWVVYNGSPNSGVDMNQGSAHWVRLRTSGGTVTFDSQGDLGGEGIATGTHVYFPSITVNSRGIVAFGFAASSPSTYVGAYVSTGTAEDATYTIKSGLAPYNRLRVGKNRWGYQSSISLDPADDSFWVFNQFAESVGSADSNGDGRWGTAWGRLACVNVPVPPPVIAPFPSPIIPPVPVPVSAPVPTPQAAPFSAPIPAPNPVANPVPVDSGKPCGLFGLSLFCPFTFCGLFGRLLGLCRS